MAIVFKTRTRKDKKVHSSFFIFGHSFAVKISLSVHSTFRSFHLRPVCNLRHMKIYSFLVCFFFLVEQTGLVKSGKEAFIKEAGKNCERGEDPVLYGMRLNRQGK